MSKLFGGFPEGGVISAPDLLGLVGRAGISAPMSEFRHLPDGTADPLFSKVVLLLRGEGRDRNMVFRDRSSYNRKPLYYAGGVENSTTQSKFGNPSLSFTGGRIYYEDSNDFWMEQLDFTFECFAYFLLSSSSSRVGLVGQADGSGGSGSFSLQKETTGVLTAQVSMPGGVVTVTSTTVITLEVFHHIALVRYGQWLALFLDGALIGAANITGPLNNSSRLFAVGGVGEYASNGYNNSFSDRMVGFLDQVRLTKGAARYTKAFDPPTVPFATTNQNFPEVPTKDPYFSSVVLLVDASNYVNGATPSTLDVTGKVPTYRNQAQIKTDQFITGLSSLYLDGTNDRVSFADSIDFNLASGDFTAELFWRADVATVTLGTTALLSQSSAYGGFVSIQVLTENSLGFCQAYSLASNGSTTFLPAAVLSYSAPAQTWNHSGIQRIGSNLYSLANGLATLITNTNPTLLDSTGAMCIGAYADADSAAQFKGWVDQVRITKGVGRYALAPNLTYTVPMVPFPHS